MKVMKKFVIASASLLLMAPAYAATTSLSSTELEEVKPRSPKFSGSFLSDSSVGRSSSDGWINSSIVYLDYLPSDQDRIRMENRVTFDRRTDREDTYFSRFVLSYRRSGLLNQVDHGVNMSAMLEQRLVPDRDFRERINQYGLTRASVSLSRSFNNGIALSATSYFAVTQRLSDAPDNTTSAYNLWYIRQSYSLTQNWYVALAQEPFFILDKKGDMSNFIYGTLETGYQFTPNVSAAIYTTATMFNGFKTLEFNNDWRQGQSYAAYVFINAF